MVVLLLAALASAQPVSLTPEVSVPFPGGAVVRVSSPTEPGADAVNWFHTETLYAPGKRVAAVRFC